MTAPRARTRTVDGARTYVGTIDGEPFETPSVNTLKGQLDAPGLNGWKVNRAIEHARRAQRLADELDEIAFRRVVRSALAGDTEAIDRGNRIHEIGEALLLGEDPPNHPETPTLGPLMEEFLDAWNVEALELPDGRPAIEATLVCAVDGAVQWAGTTDALVLFNGVPTVLDWKSGASIFPDAVLTTSGYARATHFIDDYGRALPLELVIDAGVIAHVTRDGVKAVPIETVDLDACAGMLRLLSAVWTWKQELEPPVRRPLRRR